MNRYGGSLSAFVMLFLLTARSAAAAEDVRLGALRTNRGEDWRREVNWMTPTPVMTALDPDELRRFRLVSMPSNERVVHEREAILPDPLNGPELVDRVLASKAPNQASPLTLAMALSSQEWGHTQAAVPHRIHPVLIRT